MSIDEGKCSVLDLLNLSATLDTITIFNKLEVLVSI